MGHGKRSKRGRWAAASGQNEGDGPRQAVKTRAMGRGKRSKTRAMGRGKRSKRGRWAAASGQNEGDGPRQSGQNEGDGPRQAVKTRVLVPVMALPERAERHGSFAGGVFPHLSKTAGAVTEPFGPVLSKGDVPACADGAQERGPGNDHGDHPPAGLSCCAGQAMGGADETG